MSFLDGTENMRLNNAILYREGRELMMKAYKGTVIRGSVFPHPELPDDPDWNDDALALGGTDAWDKAMDVYYNNVVLDEAVCEGLRWALSNHCA